MNATTTTRAALVCLGTWGMPLTTLILPAAHDDARVVLDERVTDSGVRAGGPLASDTAILLDGAACAVAEARHSGYGAALVLNCAAGVETLLLDHVPALPAGTLGTVSAAAAVIRPGTGATAASHIGDVLVSRFGDGVIEAAGTLSATDGDSTRSLQLRIHAIALDRDCCDEAVYDVDVVVSAWLEPDANARRASHHAPAERMHEPSPHRVADRAHLPARIS